MVAATATPALVSLLGVLVLLHNVFVGLQDVSVDALAVDASDLPFPINDLHGFLKRFRMGPGPIVLVREGHVRSPSDRSGDLLELLRL